MTITLASTTDSLEQVQAALGITPDAPTTDPAAPPAPPPAETEPPATDPAPPAPDKTLADSAASEAGKALAARKSKLQERIDNLVRDKHDSAREAQEAKKQVEDLQKRLAAVEKGEKPAPKDDAEPPAVEARAAEPPPAATPKPKQDDFDTYDEYVEALTDWKTDQKLQAREDAARKAYQEHQIQEATNAELDKRKSKITRAAEKYPDWHEKVAAAQNVPFNEQMGLYAGESEVGAELIYYLATHADRCAEIAALPPAKALLEMAKLEAQYTSNTLPADLDDDTTPGVVTSSAPSAPPKPVPPVSKAPVMVSRVSGGAGVANKPVDQMSYQEFKAWREAGGGR